MWLQVNKETKIIEGYIKSCLGNPIANTNCELVEVSELPADWQYCKWDGKALLDEAYKKEKEEEQELIEIRLQREAECFPIVNRGALWYSMLTDEQVAELDAWYQAWLDAPETKEMPTKLLWLK